MTTAEYYEHFDAMRQGIIAELKERYIRNYLFCRYMEYQANEYGMNDNPDGCADCRFWARDHYARADYAYRLSRLIMRKYFKMSLEEIAAIQDKWGDELCSRYIESKEKNFTDIADIYDEDF